MGTQAFTEAAVVFLVSVTAMNIFLNFLKLLVEEYKKCSIMDRSEPAKKRQYFGKKKQYAVLNLSDRAV